MSAEFLLTEAAQAMGGTIAPPFSGIRSQGVSIDSRTVQPGQLFMAISGPHFDGHDFLRDALARGAVAAVVHREMAGLDVPLINVSDTTRALGQLGHYLRRRSSASVVAITGSAGKTTTKEMTATLLAERGPVLKTEGNLNNQFGLPLTLARLTPEHRFAVLELGMSAAGELSALSRIAEPDVAVITLVAPVHLEFFDSIDDIARAKAEILEGLRPNGVAVLNGDDERLRRVGEAHRGRVVWFGRDRRFDVSAENWRGTDQGMRFDLRLGGRSWDVALPLAGPHFLTNFLAAAAAAEQLGASPEAIVDGALKIQPAHHRGQIFRLKQEITLLDDCYNSNPVAVEAALLTLSLTPARRRIAVLGDMLELGPSGPELHRRIGEVAAKHANVVVTVGKLARDIAEGARAAGSARDAVYTLESSDEACREIPRLTKPGDTILIKGSRGVRMESIVAALRERFGMKVES